MLRQPLLGGGAMRREMHELSMIAGSVEHAHRADGRELDDGEA